MENRSIVIKYKVGIMRNVLLVKKRVRQLQEHGEFMTTLKVGRIRIDVTIERLLQTQQYLETQLKA